MQHDDHAAKLAKFPLCPTIEHEQDTRPEIPKPQFEPGQN